MMEMILTVAMLARAFRFRFAPGARVEPKAMLFLRPEGCVPVNVRPA
jgi:hypothetical protein